MRCPPPQGFQRKYRLPDVAPQRGLVSAEPFERAMVEISKEDEAARQLQPIWSQLSEKVVRFEDSWDRSRERFDGLASEIGIEAPKEVAA